MLNTAKRSGMFSGTKWSSFGKDGWKTDAYAVGRMFARSKGWRIDHLCGLVSKPRNLSKADSGEF